MLKLSLPMVIDGAMATELERRGADIDHPLWSAKALLDSPQLVESVHYDYFAAGADIAISNSYQATFAGFADCGIDARTTRAALRNAVTLATTARRRWQQQETSSVARTLLVGASIGAYGAHRHDGSEYHGNYGVSGRVLREFHYRQFDALIETQADFIAFETIPSLIEGEAIVRLLQEFPAISAWLSFSCRDAEHVGHGEHFRDCVALANEHVGIIAVGLNCTAPQYVLPLLEQVASATSKALLCYPNSGECWDASANEWQGTADQIDFGASARRWLDAGAKLIGGCCRTTPEDIRALVKVLRPNQESSR